jgi:hypothetical protein
VTLPCVTLIRPAADARPANWLLQAGVDWWDLVRYWPPGFAAYARIAFPEDSDGPENPEAPDSDPLRAALATLVGRTTTPDRGFAAIWEGWAGGPSVPEAPRIPIPHRTMLLFAGPVAVLRDAPELAWHQSVDGGSQEPHLVWPEDQAWCVACEVDEEIEFTVGCSEEAFDDLTRALPGAVRRVQYGDPAQLYRDAD